MQVFGEFIVSPPLKERHIIYLKTFNDTIRLRTDLLCPWVPTEDGSKIVWNGIYTSSMRGWLENIINRFLAPRDYVLNGVIVRNYVKILIDAYIESDSILVINNLIY